MRSLSSLSYRSLIRRKGRYGLTAAGTALGVAVLFGVLLANRSTTDALDRAVHGAAGKTDVLVGPVGSFDAVLPAATEQQLAALPDVQAAVGSLGMRSAIGWRTSGEDGFEQNDILFLNGIDYERTRRLQDFDLAEGRLFEPGRPEVVIAETFTDRADIGVGADVTVATPSGMQPVKVVGILRASGAGLSNEGRVAFTSLPIATLMYGRGDAFTRIAVDLDDGVDRAAWIDEHRETLGESLSLQDARNLDQGFRSFVNGVNGALTLLSAIALFVGGFLIFLTFSLTVAENTRVYGTLRALGARPRQVRRVVVAEAALLGLFSSVVGLFIGYGIAALVVQVTQSLLTLDIAVATLPVAPAILCVVVGVVVSVIAAWLPARRAAALSPVAAMRQGAAASGRMTSGRAGAVLLAIGVIVSLVAPGQAVRSLGALVLLLGAVLLVPPLLRPLARVLGAVTRRLAPGVGDIAVMHLVKERSRSAYTLALVMVVLAMILSVGATNQAMAKTLDEIVDRQAGRNVQVFAAGAFDPSVEPRLASVDGVTTTSPVRFGMTDVVTDQGEPTETFATVVDPATYFEVASFPWVDGDDESARAALAAGGSVLLPESLGIGRGDDVQIRTADGLRPFTVAGTYAVLGPGFGLVAGVADLESFGTGRPNGYLLGFDDGADPDLIRHQIFTDVLPNQGVFVDTTEMVRDRARTQLSTFFSLGYATLAIAAIVGMLGLANTLIVSVITRTREVGVLRSIGARRRQVRGMVLVEAVTLAMVALALAVPLSAVLAAGIISGQRATLGFTVDFLFPWALVPILGLVTLLLAGLASLLPARRAGRMEIVTALRFD